MSWTVILRQLVILAGAGMVIYGIWMPLLGVALFRDRTFMDLSPTGAYVLIGLAIASVVAAIYRKWWGLYITGVLALTLLFYTVFEIQNRKTQVDRDIKDSVASVPGKGVVRGLVKGTHLRAGFFMMTSGAVMIVAVPLLWGRVIFRPKKKEPSPAQNTLSSPR